MKKIFACLALVLAMFIGFAAPQSAEAFDERPLGFVVIDKTGNMNGKVYRSWHNVVKWAYHFPYYKFVDTGKPQELAVQMLTDNVKIDKEVLKALAEKAQVDVLVAMKVYAMDDVIYSGFSGPFDDGNTYVLVEASADMYVYKKEGDKFLKKRLREREIRDLGNYEKPEETIKWKLSDLGNTMEGRELIR